MIGLALACVVGSTWTATAGTLAPGARCGQLVLTTDGAATDGSTGSIRFSGDLQGDIDIALTWQRLDPAPGALELGIPGGTIVMSDGTIGLYTSEASWAVHGASPLPGVLATRRTLDASNLRVTVRGTAVAAWIDGVAVGAWTLPARPAHGVVTVAVTGPRARRVRALLRDVSVTSAANTAP